MAVFSDSFTRTNENPIQSPWVSDGTSGNMQLYSNYICGAGATGCGAIYNSNCVSGKQYSQGKITNIYPGLIVRCDMSNKDNYYFLELFSATQLGFYKMVEGSSSQIGSYLTITSWTNGATLKLTADGTTFSVYINNVYQGQWTDATFGETNLGVGVIDFGSGTSKYIDDWEGGDLGTIVPMAIYTVCNKINPLIGSDPYLNASIFRRFPSQELENYEFEIDDQAESIFWVEDRSGLNTDLILDDFFEYSGIPDPLIVYPVFSYSVCKKVDPTIPVVDLVITPAARNAVCSKVNPVIRLYITPTARNAVGSRSNPSILVTPPLTVAPAARNAIGVSVNPSLLIPVMVIPVAVYAVAGKVNPAIRLYITPAAANTVPKTNNPDFTIPTVCVSAVAKVIDPYGLVTPPVVVSFEMWAHSVTTVENPFVLTDPLFLTPVARNAVCTVVNPSIPSLTLYILPDAAWAIAISLGADIGVTALQVIELVSYISTQLQLQSIIKTELGLDSEISTLLELRSVIPERITITPPAISSMFDTAVFDEGTFE
jgi:hypothetical protein